MYLLNKINHKSCTQKDAEYNVPVSKTDHQEKKKKKEKEKKKKKKIDKRKIVTLRCFSTPADNNYEVALRNV